MKDENGVLLMNRMLRQQVFFGSLCASMHTGCTQFYTYASSEDDSWSGVGEKMPVRLELFW